MSQQVQRERVRVRNKHTLTGYHTIQEDLRNAGADWVDREVVDGKLVTSRQPSDLPAFNRKMLALFARERGASNAHTTQSPSEQTSFPNLYVTEACILRACPPMRATVRTQLRVSERAKEGFYTNE